MKVHLKHGKVTQIMHGASINYRYVWDVSDIHRLQTNSCAYPTWIAGMCPSCSSHGRQEQRLLHGKSSHARLGSHVHRLSSNMRYSSSDASFAARNMDRGRTAVAPPTSMHPCRAP